MAPAATVGSFGTNILLAHHIQSDELVVNGYDVMKMNQNILNYMSRQIGANGTDIQSIVINSRADKLYTIKAPTAPAPAPQKPQEQKP